VFRSVKLTPHRLSGRQLDCFMLGVLSGFHESIPSKLCWLLYVYACMYFMCVCVVCERVYLCKCMFSEAHASAGCRECLNLELVQSCFGHKAMTSTKYLKAVLTKSQAAAKGWAHFILNKRSSRMNRVSACLPACRPACLPVCLLACLPACLSACLPVCLSVSRRTHSPMSHACMHACMHACAQSRRPERRCWALAACSLRSNRRDSYL